MSTQKEHLISLLQQKKIQLKQLQDKCDLQNKKIKLFRKENQDLKCIIDERQQNDTNTLLQSKQLLTNNSKLQKAIEQLKEQLQISKKNSQLKENKKDDKGGDTKTQSNILSNKIRGNPVVTVKDVTITQNTLQMDIPNAQLVDEDFLQVQHFQQLKTVLVNDNLLTNQSVFVICNKFINLQKLNLANNKFEAKALQNIHCLIQLKVLDIRNNNLGDQALKYISEIQKLEDLSCSKNAITDKGAEFLQKLNNLKYLDITNNQITSQGASNFTKLSKLTHLYLMSNKLTKDGILSLMKYSQQLQFLDVRFNVWNNEQKQSIKSAKTENLQVFC